MHKQSMQHCSLLRRAENVSPNLGVELLPISLFSIQADAYDDAKPGATRQRSDSDSKASSDSKSSTKADKMFVWRDDTRKRGAASESDKESGKGFFDGFFSAKSTGLKECLIFKNFLHVNYLSTRIF